MFLPSGDAAMIVASRPISSSSLGATVVIAPLAQSTTIRNLPSAAGCGAMRQLALNPFAGLAGISADQQPLRARRQNLDQRRAHSLNGPRIQGKSAGRASNSIRAEKGVRHLLDVDANDGGIQLIQA